MSQLMRLSSIGLTMVAAAACDPSSTLSPLGFVPGPTPAVYAGSIQDSLSGTGTLRLTLSTAAGVTSGIASIVRDETERVGRLLFHG